MTKMSAPGKKKDEALQRAVKKTAVFGLCLCTIMSLALGTRVPSTLNVNPLKEGKAGLAEFTSSILGLTGFFLFTIPMYKARYMKKSKKRRGSTASTAVSSVSN